MDWNKALGKITGKKSAGAPNPKHVELAKAVADKIGGVVIAGLESPDGETNYVLIADTAEAAIDADTDLRKYHASRVLTLTNEQSVEDVDIKGKPFPSLMHAQKWFVSEGLVERGSRTHAMLVASCAFHDARPLVKHLPAVKSPEDMVPMMHPHAMAEAGPELAGQLAVLLVMSMRIDVACELLEANPGATLDSEAMQSILSEMQGEYAKKTKKQSVFV